jgi:segregation and condensation protein B
MADERQNPELKILISGMIFASKSPVSIKQLRKTLASVAEAYDDMTMNYGMPREKELLAVIEELQKDCDASPLGFELAEVSGGYRYQTKSECGPWLRFLLDIGKPNRLSRPALETLAIIAYRQPVTRGEIEEVRGVASDYVIRSLMEMQLIKIVGRSELPGRPMLLGTTDLFLQHFGLKGINELPGGDELGRLPLHAQQEIPLPSEATPSQDADQPDPASDDYQDTAADSAGEEPGIAEPTEEAPS